MLAVKQRAFLTHSAVRLDLQCVIGIFWFLRSAQKHDEALPALDAVIVPFAGAVISDTMVKHPSLFDNIKSILRGNDQIIFICIGILFLQFLADGANMGVLLVHVLCLKLQASSLTLDNQFIMPLTQFTRTIDNFIAGVDMQTLCHSKVVLPCGQRLPTTSVKIRLLFLQIVSDLNRTHAVRDEQNIFGADPFFFKPAKQFIRYALIGPLFKLQPCQVFRIAIYLPQTAEFGAV